MEAIFAAIGPMDFGISLGWSEDRSEWFRTKEQIKGSFGTRWDEVRKFWIVPFDHTENLVRGLNASGITTLVSDADMTRYNAYLVAQERWADLSFLLELPPDIPPITHPFLTSPLRPYQQVAVAMMGLFPGCGLLEADPVGTGKSIVAIADMFC